MRYGVHNCGLYPNSFFDKPKALLRKQNNNHKSLYNSRALLASQNPKYEIVPSQYRNYKISGQSDLCCQVPVLSLPPRKAAGSTIGLLRSSPAILLAVSKAAPFGALWPKVDNRSSGGLHRQSHLALICSFSPTAQSCLPHALPLTCRNTYSQAAHTPPPGPEPENRK